MTDPAHDPAAFTALEADLALEAPVVLSRRRGVRERLTALTTWMARWVVAAPADHVVADLYRHQPLDEAYRLGRGLAMGHTAFTACLLLARIGHRFGLPGLVFAAGEAGADDPGTVALMACPDGDTARLAVCDPYLGGHYVRDDGEPADFFAVVDALARGGAPAAAWQPVPGLHQVALADAPAPEAHLTRTADGRAIVRHPRAPAAGTPPPAALAGPGRVLTAWAPGLHAGEDTAETLRHALPRAAERPSPVAGYLLERARTAVANGDTTAALALARQAVTATADDAERCLEAANLALGAGAPRVALALLHQGAPADASGTVAEAAALLADRLKPDDP